MRDAESGAASGTGMNHEDARERLMEAVDAICDVQENYDLTEDEDDMLADAKSSVAAVHFHCDNQNVVFDL